MNDWSTLTRAASEAMQNAYAPYSRFRVGVALECADGTIVPGANVENASFGLTICAERTAVAAAVASGRRDFRRIAIVTEAPIAVAPCGACRQVLAEFAPELPIRSVYADGEHEWSLDALLPAVFDFEAASGARGVDRA